MTSQHPSLAGSMPAIMNQPVPGVYALVPGASATTGGTASVVEPSPRDADLGFRLVPTSGEVLAPPDALAVVWSVGSAGSEVHRSAVPYQTPPSVGCAGHPSGGVSPGSGGRVAGQSNGGSVGASAVTCGHPSRRRSPPTAPRRARARRPASDEGAPAATAAGLPGHAVDELVAERAERVGGHVASMSSARRLRPRLHPHTGRALRAAESGRDVGIGRGPRRPGARRHRPVMRGAAASAARISARNGAASTSSSTRSSSCGDRTSGSMPSRRR